MNNASIATVSLSGALEIPAIRGFGAVNAPIRFAAQTRELRPTSTLHF